MKKKWNGVVVVGAVVMAVVAAVIVIGWGMPTPKETLQGEVELSDYRVSGKVPGRVKELRVNEGDAVKAGDTLVILEAPEVEAKLQQAQAAYRAASAVEQKASNGTRSEQIQQAYEMLQKAKAAEDVMKKTYERVERLYASGVVAEQKRDEAKAQYEAAAATTKAAEAQYEMAKNGARSEDKAASAAQAARAKAAISEVNSYLNEMVLTASADGVVTEIFPEIGELVGTGSPIMNVARMDDVKCIFNIREDYLPGMTVGSEHTVYLPAFDREIKIRITRVKDVGTYAVWKATKALDGYDLKTFEVRGVPLDTISGLRSGMTVVIENPK